MNVITPFSGVTLQVGGSVETYWKSLAMPVPNTQSKPHSKAPQSGRPATSTHTSPSNFSVPTSGSHSLTHSSVTGSYVFISVQVTRDLHPVVFPQWNLPEIGYDLGVSDVTLQQFEFLAKRLGRSCDSIESSSFTASDWSTCMANRMVSLADALEVRSTIYWSRGVTADLTPADPCQCRYLYRAGIPVIESSAAPIAAASSGSQRCCELGAENSLCHNYYAR